MLSCMRPDASAECKECRKCLLTKVQEWFHLNQAAVMKECVHQNVSAPRRCSDDGENIELICSPRFVCDSSLCETDDQLIDVRECMRTLWHAQCSVLRQALRLGSKLSWHVRVSLDLIPRSACINFSKVSVEEVIKKTNSN